MNKHPFRFIVILGLCLTTTLLHADIWGVEDAILIEKAVMQLRQLEQQYRLLKDSYETSKSQLDSMKSLKQFNSGSYGFGALDNGIDMLRQRQDTVNTWDEALKNIAGGNPGRYAELVRAYDANHPTLSDSDYLKGASNSRLQQYKHSAAVNKAVAVETTHVFNELNQHIKAIHTLSTAIDKAPNTKAAIDLNSRLIAELGYIQVMQVKLQTLISQQNVQDASGMLADEAELVRFNTLPKK